MKALAIHLQTTNNLNLTTDQKDLLKDYTTDRRLKKAEAIKAYFESQDYVFKKVAFQMKHAEFGLIHQISTFDGRDTDVASTEESALHLIDRALNGVERLIVFDAGFTLPFILKRAMLTGHDMRARYKLYSSFGDATTAIIDIKKLWAGQSREYSGMSLNELSLYLDISSNPSHEAERVYEIYERMVDYLCS